MGRPKYVDSPCNNENNCESISGQAKHVITSSLSPLSCTSGINRHDNTSPEPVESSLASHSSNTPTHLHFSKSKNVDLRTMRMVNQATLAGYNPFRGDFEVEFDNNAENLVCLARSLDDHKNLNSENQTKQTKLSNKLLTELQIVLGECYNSHLKERQKRKEIIKNYGLMNRKGHHRWCTKLQNSLGKSTTKKMIHIAPLLPTKEAENLFSSLQNVYDKRAQLNKLIFYRSHYGVTTSMSVKFVENIKKIYCKSERVDIRNLLTPPTIKRNKTPLQIFHLPRYRELTPSEADFCSLNNLEPGFFLDTKDLLITDCTKYNGMLLKRARKLVKIDVNKTRKMFDLLMEQGLIWPVSK